MKFGDTVKILDCPTRKGQLAKVMYVRFGPPNYTTVVAASLWCQDGRQAIYSVEKLALQPKLSNTTNDFTV